ncbi:restriction endonuclease subunit S [Staphylococcus casei]|uniref:restriction endonuclease subunit S n=1 Tax=Staphylococcus casei TaxID=201828 RepID=UPI000CD023D9|nr:restriction endonuclease subunit S [Staphylococcus casei]PNZ61104.1 restriction endonuclease subunit S [Staphylococcus casei]WJE87744.1 restriction endonuclease subunit S [Staphylococcus casei]
MTNEVKKVPELRFPEFDGEWEETRADELFSSISDKNHSGMLQPLSATQDRGMVLREELDKDIQFNNKSLKSYKKTLPGDFIISLRSFQGGFEYNNLLGLVSPAYTVLRKNDDNIDEMFFKYYFKRSWFIKKLDSMIYGIRDGKSISFNDFSTFKINISSLNEQQKIGEFFSKLDQQIELEEQKLSLLEEQKKGYMQKIFSQELRFKDESGNEYPEWEDKLISDIGKVVTGNTPSKKDNDYWNSNQYVWVTPTDISNKKNIYTSGYQLSQKGFSKARQLPKNTLLITCIASIGKNAILRIEGSCNQQINAVIPNDNYDVDYLYYAFEDVSKLMKSIAGKTATQIVNKAVFEKLLLNVPIYEEQQKISGFLNKVDILIDKQTQKIDELKLRKQGFLQKMFV